MRWAFIVITVVALCAALLSAPATGARYLGGGVTGNNATDTTMVRVGSIPGAAHTILVWNPDAELWIKIDQNSTTSETSVVMLVPASSRIQEISAAFADTVHVNKTTTQRVGIFFAGD